MIKLEHIRSGLEQGIIRLVPDPLEVNGTVCQIGDEWFYFGDYEAETMTPEEYLKNMPADDIAREIFETLDSFKDAYDEAREEYEYYEAVLAFGLKVVLKATHIQWDTDGNEQLASTLPKEIELPVGMTDVDAISDYLSDTTGFCHFGFDIEMEEQEHILPVKDDGAGGIPLIMEFNDFANRCGFFFNCNLAPEYEGCEDHNNGYNCSHPDQEDVEEDDYIDMAVGNCHCCSCPFGYQADARDLVEHGVISEDEIAGLSDDEIDELDMDDEYIVITDPDTVNRLRSAGITGCATK